MFLLRTHRKSVVEQLIERPILLTFVNLSTISFAWSSEERLLYIVQLRLLELAFSVDFSIPKSPINIIIDS